MKTVNEVSKLTGVSVRALHHYDAIGLLKPTQVTDANFKECDIITERDFGKGYNKSTKEKRRTSKCLLSISINPISRAK